MSLHEWLKENADRGVSKRSVRAALKNVGYTDKQIAAALVGYTPLRSEPVGLSVLMAATIVLVALMILVGLLL